jgi:Domain of unknown function (DUF5060)/Putative collagen-binding domain of a collagenase/Gylcosyl hydrolase family 115 C-terminal domain
MKPQAILTTLSLLTSALAGETITIEAESFTKQSLTEKRRWEMKSEHRGASGGSYIQALPDTRQSHDDKLIKGENFTDTPGEMAVLEYPFEVKEPGRYFVWARTWSSNSEDNGLHFGLDGQWPESGERWQTVKTGAWNWDCKQRTSEVHTGVPMQLWLEIDKPGKHTLMLSMREDGTALDQIMLVNDAAFRPEGVSYEEKASAKKPKAPVARQPNGDASVKISGELKQWHKVTLTLDGPFAAETDGSSGVRAAPRNGGVLAPSSSKRGEDAAEPSGGGDAASPFTDLAFNVTFTHESGAPKYTVPGYFAADGQAANSSAESGTKWLAHLSPDKTGTWTYAISFTQGKNAALEGGGEALKPFDGLTGSFTITDTDKTGVDFRSKGRLQYVSKHHLQFAGSKEYFFKAGPDAPETLLAYTEFDNTSTGKVPLKTWQPHVQDWKAGDPTWKDGKGKGLIGALNYLSAKGVNAFSFLTYNASGDGDNVWPFADRDDKLHYDCSKLDQWGIVFDHATQLGLYLHFKLQENEMDDDRLGAQAKTGKLSEALNGGKLGIERKLYCRELIARFGHALALNWNIGEENTQSSEEVRDMVKYLHDTDPYQHHIVLHTFPPQQELKYDPLLGQQSLLTGVSLQNSWKAAHERTLHWLRASDAAGRPWVVANDEQNPAGLGVPPDPGYKGHDGIAIEKDKKKQNATTGDVKSKAYTMHDVRKLTLWGSFMAGGAGVEYYFGYALPENDLVCEDFRSRDKSWDYCRIALNFFHDEKIPFAEMQSADELIGNNKGNNDKFCFAKAGELYLVYLPNGGETQIDLTQASGKYTVQWFNPREGGALIPAKDPELKGGVSATLLAPSLDDWLAVIRKSGL